ncbi:MAG: hypothetical protein K1X47_16160 [Cyclobacteriaceae bacterium]|nr:hypothetical protein [Cyclobacteriaceae bacterium]
MSNIHSLTRPRTLLSLLLIVCLSPLRAQTSEFTASVSALIRIGTIESAEEQLQQAALWWTQHQEKGQIPLIAGDSVAFLYKGDAHTVKWMGDFNAWGYDKNVANSGTRIGKTDIWLWRTSFPGDARFDYKIAVDDKDWMLDPENPYQQWSGVGGGSPNSELRMPAWKEDEVQHERPQISHGSITNDILLHSKVLGYQLMYSVYIPVHKPADEPLPVLYVTDGYEYLHPKMGNMVTVLDNLIADHKIVPLAVIFIDHREPVNRGNNKRMTELAMNQKYLQFFVDEFLPRMEHKYPISRDGSKRGILGASMGGLNAAFFAFSKPEVFGLVGLQSPAFWTRPQIYNLCGNPAGNKVTVSMTSGVINDASEGSRKMKTVFESNACVYHYREVNDGHSWGNWRNLLDDVLIDLYAPK